VIQQQIEDWGTMPPLWGPDRVICVDGEAFIFQVWNSVAEHDKTPTEKNDDYPASSISTAIIDNLDLLSHQGSIFFNTCFQLHKNGLTVSRSLEYLLPGAYNLHRPSALMESREAQNSWRRGRFSLRMLLHIGFQDTNVIERKSKRGGQLRPFDKRPLAGCPDI